MVRWLILAWIVIAISGLGAWLVISGVPSEPDLGGVLPGAGRSAGKSPPPHLVLDGPPIHDFGQMAQQKKGQHTWQIRNEGPGDLRIIGGQPSCSCTVPNLKPGQTVVLEPGETYDMGVEWETRLTDGAYENSARIYTNDPARPELTFRVKGTVRPVLLVAPQDGLLDVRTLTGTEPHEFVALLGSPDRPDLKITKITATRPDLIEVIPLPMTAEEAKAFHVSKGFHLQFRIKPTARLGPFREEVVIRTDHPDRDEVRFTVAGRMVGPISVVPPVVRLNDVTTRSGGSASLTLWVQGQDRTAFHVAQKSDKLKVTFRPDDDKDRAQDAAGKGRAYRMTVAVGQGTPSGIINDPIVLETDHPKAHEIEIPVQILVMSEE